MIKWCCSKSVVLIVLQLSQLETLWGLLGLPVLLCECVCVCVLVKICSEATVLTCWGFLFSSSTCIQSDLSNALSPSPLWARTPKEGRWGVQRKWGRDSKWNQSSLFLVCYPCLSPQSTHVSGRAPSCGFGEGRVLVLPSLTESPSTWTRQLEGEAP